MAKKERPQLILDNGFSEMDKLHDWLLWIKDNFKFYGKPKHEEKWLNVPASFDIETTNFYNNEGEKRACMYIWMVSIFGKAFYGRTWFEFIQLCNECVEVLELDINHRLIFYIHNASFEMGFMENLFEWENIFATDFHKVIYALTKTGIEFRCSLFLYGASLDHLGKKGLTTFEVKKATGTMDYSLFRHYLTPLTDVEKNYCLQDVQVVVAYIEEKIIQEKRISQIPLTKTGFPRRLLRNRMLYSKGSYDTRKLLEKLTYTLQEYLLLKWSFAGGFTHGSCLKIGKVWYDVASQDFTSSYPYHLLLPIYPIGKGEAIKIESEDHFRRNLKGFCCLMHLRIKGIKPKVNFEHILSVSKCKNEVNAKVDNGRIISCDSCEVAMNEIDFEMFEKFYTYESFEVLEFYRYFRGYLPKQFIETILELYWKKNVYKYDAEMATEYKLAKENLNAMYGVCVTDIIRNSFKFNSEKGWYRDPVNYQDAINKYNEKKSRFISYGWGCWCTSAGRRSLQNAILALSEDYIYSDTDSVKYLHKEKHDAFFEAYNASVVKNLQDMCDFFKIPFERCSPNGKTIGVFDYEGKYRRFKTLGAKRYMTQNAETGIVSLTVAGLNKKTAKPYIEINNTDPFEAFAENLHVPEGFAGKLTHTYSDEGFSDFLTDYQGTTACVSESSFVHLEEASYSLSLAEEFKKYIDSLKGR